MRTRIRISIAGLFGVIAIAGVMAVVIRFVLDRSDVRTAVQQDLGLDRNAVIRNASAFRKNDGTGRVLLLVVIQLERDKRYLLRPAVFDASKPRIHKRWTWLSSSGIGKATEDSHDYVKSFSISPNVEQLEDYMKKLLEEELKAETAEEKSDK